MTSSSTSKSLHNLSGTYKLNKSLSDDITPVLAIQGTNLLIRKAIGAASVTLKITQPTRDEYHIHQTATSASIPGTTEKYILDDKDRDNHDAFFGDVKGRSRWISLKEGEGMFGDFAGEWDVAGEEEEQGEDEERQLILAQGGSSDGKWSAVRIWGFEKVEGERRYTQRVKVSNQKGEEVRVKMVHDLVD